MNRKDNNTNDTVALPRKTVRQMFEAIEAFEDAQNELEDYLTLRSDSVMSDVEKARGEHERGESKVLQKAYAGE